LDPPLPGFHTTPAQARFKWTTMNEFASQYDEVDLRPRSIGELLDRSVTISLHNVLPLGAIAACAVLAEFLISLGLSDFVFPQLFPKVPWLDATDVAAILVVRDVIVTLVDDIVAAVGVMASAVVIEDVLSGTQPDVRGALAEAFDGFGGAMLVFQRYLFPIALAVGIGRAGEIAIRSNNHLVIALGDLLMVLAVFGFSVIHVALFVAWVHVALRKSDLGGWQLEGGLFAVRPNAATALAALTFLGLTNAADVADWVSVHTHSMPIVASHATFYGLQLVSRVLLYSFVTFLYLDLCVRYAGIDLEEDVGNVIHERKATPT
jgi:hypothetical protein